MSTTDAKVTREWGEGPEGDKDVLAFINETPLLLSLLYDLDLLPEQHPDHESPAWEKIFTITNHWREATIQSLSQEAVREEADVGLFAAGRMLGFTMGLEEAAKLCDKHADDWLPHHIPEKGTSKNPIYWQQRHEAAERCAELIRALKREPNAAGRATGREQSHAAGDGQPAASSAAPAPAAPDVASMMKRLNEALPRLTDVTLSAYAKHRTHLHECLPLLRDAAALLAKLGQSTRFSWGRTECSQTQRAAMYGYSEPQMTDTELAASIENEVNSWSSTYPRLGLSKPQWQQIIAALRRGPERCLPSLPPEIQEWCWHMDLHLTEHDEKHAGLALRAAWPPVSEWLKSVVSPSNIQGTPFVAETEGRKP